MPVSRVVLALAPATQAINDGSLLLSAEVVPDSACVEFALRDGFDPSIHVSKHVERRIKEFKRPRRRVVIHRLLEAILHEEAVSEFVAYLEELDQLFLEISRQ